MRQRDGQRCAGAVGATAEGDATCRVGRRSHSPKARVVGGEVLHIKEAGDLAVGRLNHNTVEGDIGVGGVIDLYTHDGTEGMEVEVVGPLGRVPVVLVAGHHREYLLGEGVVVAQGLHVGEENPDRGEIGADDVALVVGVQAEEGVGTPGERGDEDTVEIAEVLEVALVGEVADVDEAAGVEVIGVEGDGVAGDGDDVADLPINPLFVDEMKFGGVGGAGLLDACHEGVVGSVPVNDFALARGEGEEEHSSHHDISHYLSNTNHELKCFFTRSKRRLRIRRFRRCTL